MYTVPKVLWHFKSEDIDTITRTSSKQLRIVFKSPDKDIFLPSQVEHCFFEDFPEWYITPPEEEERLFSEAFLSTYNGLQ